MFTGRARVFLGGLGPCNLLPRWPESHRNPRLHHRRADDDAARARVRRGPRVRKNQENFGWYAKAQGVARLLL